MNDDPAEELRIAEADIRRLEAQIAYETEQRDKSNRRSARELRLVVMTRDLQRALDRRSQASTAQIGRRAAESRSERRRARLRADSG